MIAKPAIGWLNSDAELLLINDVTVVFNAMTDNVDIYANPDPPLTEIKLDLDNYATAVYLPNPEPDGHHQQKQPAPGADHQGAFALVLCGEGVQRQPGEPDQERVPAPKRQGPARRPPGPTAGPVGQPRTAAQPVGGQGRPDLWRGLLQLSSDGEHARRGAGDRAGHGGHPHVPRPDFRREIHH